MSTLHSIILEWDDIIQPKNYAGARKLARTGWQKGEWRLPTRTEIQFAIQERIAGFVEPNRVFWTAHQSGNGKSASVICTIDGELTWSDKKDCHWVRLVRFAQNPTKIHPWDD